MNIIRLFDSLQNDYSWQHWHLFKCSITSSNIAYMSVTRFKPTERQLKWYKDGGVAIIDQVICSYAQYFVGTRESTFTFRIQEEREMLGFTLEE